MAVDYPGRMTTTQAAEQLEDSLLAVTDADLIAAGIRELHEALAADRLDALTVSDVAGDLLPRIAALRTWLLEQVAEVTR